MEEWQIHSNGSNEHMKLLIQKFQRIIERVKNDYSLSEKEKHVELKKV